ncbi:hypothetical protein GX865_00410 [Candidatus Saccharibacteria bacterium]|jgi:hypothetical protein|nr:hypothetical protein [Candidatus Saccharibacteria bacterium]
MSQKQIMKINGREYDILTGLPIENSNNSSVGKNSIGMTSVRPSKNHRQKAKASSLVHQKTQRSTTLNRHFVKKSTIKKASTQKVTQAQKATIAQPNKATSINPVIQNRSRKRIDGMRPITSQGSTARANAKLAQSVKKKGITLEPTHSTPIISITPPEKIDKPMAHPIVERVHQKQAQKKAPDVQSTSLSASVLKQAAINEAMEKAPKHHAKQYKQKARHGRLFSIISAFAALVLFAGYLTYLNVPNLSVRVAAAQAGINASYPGYRPDGYKLNGPVAFSDGEVRMQFTAATGDRNFTLKQSRSSWDSNALLENYVKEKSDDYYTTSQEKGITVYSFNGNAAWVSGGILYTIDGDAQLSPDQIRKIATSV